MLMEIDSATEKLISRGVDHLRYPDKIYALGGAGIKMVSEMFQDDWFAVEAMRKGGGEGSIDIHFIDTATESDENHEKEIRELQQQYNEFSDEMSEELDGDSVRDIDITYHFLNDAIRIRERAHITGQSFVNRILNNTDADYWWVESEHLDSRERPGQLYDISKGVIRRRALGKGLHYKALAEQANYRNDIFSLTDRDQEIAIFAGLAGGTGSGLMIDVAKQIKDQRSTSNVTLFGTLSSLRETPREKSNTYGALSELEYLHLDKERRNPFNNIVLLPLDPTGHDTGATETRELVEFDRALQYAVIGYHNNDEIDPALSGTTAHSPFTIAVPQVFRYKVRAINQAKDRAAEILETKREALDAEWKLYDEIASFVKEEYANTAEAELTAEDLEAIRQRFREFRDLVELEIFDRLDYDPAKEGEDLLDQVYSTGREDPDSSATDLDDIVTSETVDDIVQDIEFFLQNSAKEPGKLQEINELTENALDHIIFEDLHRIKKQAELRKLRKRTIEDDGEDSVERVIRYMLNENADETVGRNRWGTLSTKLEEIEDERGEVQERIDEIDAEIEREKQRVQEQAADFFQNWYTTVEWDIEELLELKSVDIDAETTELRRELDNFANDIESNPPESARPERIYDSLNAVEDKLAGVDRVDFTPERRDIEESLDLLIEAREQWDSVEEEESGGLIRSGGEAPDERRAYNQKQTELNRLGMFQVENIPPNVEDANFNARTVYSAGDSGHVQNELESERESLTESLRESFQDRLRNEIDDRSIVDTAVAQFDGVLDQNSAPEVRDECQHIVEDAFEKQISDKIPSLEQERTEKSRRLGTIDDREARFGYIKNRFPQWNDLHTQFADAHREFVGNIRGGMDLLGSDDTRTDRLTNNYIHEVPPESIHNAIQHDTLAESSLLTVENEVDKVRRTIDRIVDNRILDPQFNSLQNRRISTPDSVYTDTFVNAAVISPAVSRDGSDSNKLSPDFFDLEDRMRENFTLDDPSGGNTEEYWYVENGGPWDIGICVYLQGITFLDNLREIKHASRGYEDIYKSNEYEQAPTKALVRHAARLEEGYFIRRRETLNVLNNPEKFVDPSSDEIADNLRARIEEVRIDEDEPTGVKTEETAED